MEFTLRNMQAIPRCFRPYLYAPQQAVAIVNSGNRRWYVKLEKGVLNKRLGRSSECT